MLEKTLESPLDCKEIRPVNPKGDQSWIFTGRTDAEAEAPILWPLDTKSQFTGKKLMLGKTEGRRENGQQRMRWLDGILSINGQEFEQTTGDSEGQGSLLCGSPWGCRVGHDLMTEQQQFVEWLWRLNRSIAVKCWKYCRQILMNPWKWLFVFFSNLARSHRLMTGYLLILNILPLLWVRLF